MKAYVIAKIDCDEFDTPVFSAGEDGSEEAVVVFTSQAAAEAYIADADWSDDHQVGQLDDIQLLRWMVAAHEFGTQFLVVNPDRARQLAGEPLDILVIEDNLAELAELLAGQIQKAAPSAESR